ncbi:MAG: hypothetical protein ACOZIN_09295 [Myxococcota bacterium]
MVVLSTAALAASLPGGLSMPSVEDERDAYTLWGWTWTLSQLPSVAAQPTYTVSAPDIHSDTEGDDLWSYVMMYRRSSQPGYLDRANAWARYFRDDYRQCIPSGGSNYCYDRDNYISDHQYGWGLVAMYEFTGDAVYLAAAEAIAGDVETRVNGITPGQTRVSYWGMRKWARHLLLATRVAEAKPSTRWTAMRDRLIDAWMMSPDWDARGMYFNSQESIDLSSGAGTYASGRRAQSTFQIGIAAEALYQAFRTTGRTDVKDRLVAMARYVDQNGLDATYQYAGSSFGYQGSASWHNYSANGTPTFWDPVYTTSLVNTLVLGYKLTGETTLFERAKYFFNRGTKGVYGSPTQRAADDSTVHHFVDSTFDSSSGSFYLAYNKGELQYTYLLFENGGRPTVLGAPSADGGSEGDGGSTGGEGGASDAGEGAGQGAESPSSCGCRQTFSGAVVLGALFWVLGRGRRRSRFARRLS